MPSPKIVKVAYIVAFLLALIEIVPVFTGEQRSAIFIPFAAVPVVAAIGMIRNRVWSAYGFALYTFSTLVLLALLVFQSGGVRPDLLLALLIGIALVGLFLFTGRSLQAAGFPRGLRSPWIAISVLRTLPLIFVAAYLVPTPSMEDTLLVGDQFLYQHWPKPTPAHDGLLVFRYPYDRSKVYVTRVIGIPGDRIRISNKQVYRNGIRLNEPYAVHKALSNHADDFPDEPNPSVQDGGLEMLQKHVVLGEVVVPEKSYFVMGDNRDNSFDSRYWGFITTDDIVGKPLLIYYSRDLEEDGYANAGKPVGLSRVRWRRLFKVLR